MIEKENNGEFLEDTKERYLKLYDKTRTINDETDKIGRHKHDFMNFCGQKRSLKKVQPGCLKLLSENGEQYASIQCKTGDCPEKNEEGNITTERNELWLENGNGEGKNDDFEFNKSYNYKFSFRIPENFPLSPTRLVIGQWKYNKMEGSNEKKDPNPMLAQRIKRIKGEDGKYKYFFVITDGTEKKNILGKIPFDDIKGKWVDMDYEIRFSDKKDGNGNPIPCTLKIKADVEGERKIDKETSFYLAEENNLQFNSKQSHTGYFKFGLYRDNYDYVKTKIKDQEGLDELEQAQKTEKQNPMQIYFKNFSMKDLGYKEFEKEKQQSKNEQQSLVGNLIKRFKHLN